MASCKQSVRTVSLQYRKSLSQDYQILSSQRVVQAASEFVKAQAQYKKEIHIFNYAATQAEIDISGLVASLRDLESLHWYLPVVLNATDMCFRPVDWKASEFYENRWGITEPLPSKTLGLMDVTPSSFQEFSQKDSVCLVFSPCLAVHEKGYRLGYGGGFYDRFFASVNRALYTYVGVCFAACFPKDFPVDTYDLALDVLFTENSVDAIVNFK